MKQRPLKSMPMYDRGLRARVFPWTHHLHSWIGYIYVFDDRDHGDMLVYFVPIAGAVQFRVHRTMAVFDTDAPFGYRIITDPDPDVDATLGDVGL